MAYTGKQGKNLLSSSCEKSTLFFLIFCLGLWTGGKVEAFIFSAPRQSKTYPLSSPSKFAVRPSLDNRCIKGFRSIPSNLSPLHSTTTSNLDESSVDYTTGEKLDPSYFNPRKKSIYVDAPTNVETLKYKDTQFIAVNMDREDSDLDVFEDIRLPNCAEHTIFTRSSYLDPEAPVKVFWDYGVVRDDLQGNRGNLYGMTTLDGTAKYIEKFVNSDPYNSPEINLYKSQQIYRWSAVEDPSLNYEEELCHVLIALDKKSALSTRRENRDDHLKYLKESGRVVAAGPLFDIHDEMKTTPIGSMVLFNEKEFESNEDFIKNDPYAKAGVFESIFTSLLAPLDTTGQHILEAFATQPNEKDPVRDAMIERGFL